MGGEVPIIDVAPLLTPGGDCERVGAEIRTACSRSGFFYIVGHGVSERLSERLEAESRRFFALPSSEKKEIEMERGGRAWRGFFPVGGELTLGRPDQKEGLYFGEELGPEDPRVVAGTPLHGPNLFPVRPAGLRDGVLEYMAALTALSHAVMRGLAVSLGLEADYFRTRYTADPLVLFRIFHYPPLLSDTAADGAPQFSVGEHTDYGLLTILRQTSAGLEVKVQGEWQSAPPVPGSFVCNLGDMLDRMTSGFYRSTAHRVRNRTGSSRFSFPFFFDPAFDAEVSPIEVGEGARRSGDARWDGIDVHDWSGTYGDYLLDKVGRVFPGLGREVL